MSTAEATPSLSVREALPADAQWITRLDAAETGVSKPDHWKNHLAQCQRSEGLALVATHDGDGVGYILGEIRAWEFGSPPTGWIYAVGVQHQARHLGVGRTLLTGALQVFRQRGVNAVRTMIRRDDVGLLRFFRRAGFAAGPFVELEVEYE